MTSTHRVTRVRGLRWRRRVRWKILDAWYAVRRAVRYCTPDNARRVGWRLFLVIEASILAAWWGQLLPKSLTKALMLAGMAGFASLLLALDAQLKAQQRRWREMSAGRLIGVPAEPVQPAEERLRSLESKAAAMMATLDDICSAAGMPVPDGPAAGDGDRRSRFEVLQGGKSDPAA